jgi:hypothetical protein
MWDTVSAFRSVSTSPDQAHTEVLVRRFGQTFENVYTLCLASAPIGFGAAFECDWLVGMSEKAGRAVRVGCGRYEWQFRRTAPSVAERLTITIERMEALPPSTLAPVMQWLSSLPYPWCPTETAARSVPGLSQLSDISAFIGRSLL